MKKLSAAILFLVFMLGFAINPLVAEAAKELKIESNEMYENHIDFNENDFLGMTITYTVDGIPIVDDPNATPNSLLKAIEATVISPYGYFYSDSSLKESTLLFSIPRGKAVQVIDNNLSSSVVKIKYAGYVGYIRKSNLKL